MTQPFYVAACGGCPCGHRHPSPARADECAEKLSLDGDPWLVHVEDCEQATSKGGVCSCPRECLTDEARGLLLPKPRPVGRVKPSRPCVSPGCRGRSHGGLCARCYMVRSERPKRESEPQARPGGDLAEDHPKAPAKVVLVEPPPVVAARVARASSPIQQLPLGQLSLWR